MPDCSKCTRRRRRRRRTSPPRVPTTAVVAAAACQKRGRVADHWAGSTGPDVTRPAVERRQPLRAARQRMRSVSSSGDHFRERPTGSRNNLKQGSSFGWPVGWASTVRECKESAANVGSRRSVIANLSQKEIRDKTAKTHNDGLPRPASMTCVERNHRLIIFHPEKKHDTTKRDRAAVRTTTHRRSTKRRALACSRGKGGLGRGVFLAASVQGVGKAQDTRKQRQPTAFVSSWDNSHRCCCAGLLMWLLARARLAVVSQLRHPSDIFSGRL